MKTRTYPKELKTWLVSNYKGEVDDILDNVNKKFNCNLTRKQLHYIIYQVRKKYNIPYLEHARFNNGNVPHNKGRSISEYLSEDKMKKVLANLEKRKCSKVGSELLKPTGYIYVKKLKNGKSDWVCKQRYVYEQHYGKIPNGYVVTFIDGNKNNCDLSNLKIVTKDEERYISRNGLHFKNKELNETSILLTKMILTASKRKKKLSK